DARRSMTLRQFILALGLHTTKEMLEDGFGAYWHAEGRKSGARLLGGHFIGRLAHHFGLVSDDGLRGLSVVAYELPLIDMGELAVSAPVQAPLPPPPPPAVGRTMPQRLGRLKEEIQGLRRDIGSLRRLVERSMPEQGSSLVLFKRRTRQRTSGASTSAAP
ncbi:hypothetical protein Tco_0666367, partial [Tanacetum coccineum]